MNKVTVSIESLSRIGTCILCANGEDVLIGASECLCRLMGGGCVGKKLDELLVRGTCPPGRMLLRTLTDKYLRLRGNWLPLDDGNGRVFVGSPAPETAEQIEELGITINDFLENDSWLNFLLRSDEASATQRDSKQRIEQLKEEQQRLAVAHRQVIESRAAGLNMMLDLERARGEAEAATRAKSEFLANMSHEIRTPMTAILGFTDIMLDQRGVDGIETEAVEAAKTIKRNGEYLLDIINDILDLSKIEAGRMEIETVACSVIQIVAEIASLMQVRADAKGLSFDVIYETPIPETISIDPTRLRQVLINLVGNAIKFTEVGGVQLMVRFSDDVGGALLEFDIEDTGRGMTGDQVAKLFQPFAQADASTTRKFGGTGLGLTISQRLSQILGGDISLVRTEKGVGSVFRLTLVAKRYSQLVEDPKTAMSVRGGTLVGSTPMGKGDLAGLRLLLAEDGPDNQRLISYVLRKAGAEVVVAGNGQSAVDQALAARDIENAPFDAVLMDMQMPVLDGYQATRQLRRDGYSGLVIALTAHAMASDEGRCLEAGCDAYATKPIDRGGLIELIKSRVSLAIYPSPS